MKKPTDPVTIRCSLLDNLLGHAQNLLGEWAWKRGAGTRNSAAVLELEATIREATDVLDGTTPETAGDAAHPVPRPATAFTDEEQAAYGAVVAQAKALLCGPGRGLENDVLSRDDLPEPARAALLELAAAQRELSVTLTALRFSRRRAGRTD